MYSLSRTINFLFLKKKATEQFCTCECWQHISVTILRSKNIERSGVCSIGGFVIRIFVYGWAIGSTVFYDTAISDMIAVSIWQQVERFFTIQWIGYIVGTDNGETSIKCKTTVLFELLASGQDARRVCCIWIAVYIWKRPNFRDATERVICDLFYAQSSSNAVSWICDYCKR